MATTTASRKGNQKVATKARRSAHAGQRSARRANRSWAGAVLARGGLVARGVVYLLLAYLVADMVVGGGSRNKNASSQGAFETIRHQPAGPLLVLLVAIGFGAYGCWRALQAAAGDVHEDGGDEFAKRFGWACIAIIYFLLAVSALEEALGDSSGTNQVFSFSREVLKLPGGQVALAATGFGIVVGGVWLATWACMQRFNRYLLTRKLAPWEEVLAHVIETFGNATRGLAFAAVGGTFVAASIRDDPKNAKGLNGTLQVLVGHPYGRILLGVAAAGFGAFGLASLFEARYRDIDANAKK